MVVVTRPLLGHRHQEHRMGFRWLEDRPLKPEPSPSPAVHDPGSSRAGKHTRSHQASVSAWVPEGATQASAHAVGRGTHSTQPALVPRQVGRTWGTPVSVSSEVWGPGLAPTKPAHQCLGPSHPLW